MNSNKKQLNPSTLLAPVPVVLVSCKHSGQANLITIAWVGTICSDPPMVSISIRPSRLSYQMIMESKEFVINLVDKKLLKAADYCGVKSGRDTDKFIDCHLTAVEAAGLSQAPAIAESPLSLSCRLNQVVKLGSHDCFIAEIVSVEAKEELFDNNDRLCLEKAELVAYSHGQYHSLGPVLGFFGFSVASNDVLQRRMPKNSKPRDQKSKKNQINKKSSGRKSGVKRESSGKWQRPADKNRNSSDGVKKQNS